MSTNAPEHPNPTARTRMTDTQTMWANDHASRGLGMQLIDVSPGRAVITMPITRAMANGHGLCHGGFIFALADSTFAFACNSHGEAAVASTCTITFLRPGKVGDTLTATATEREKAGRSGIYDVTVRDAGGITIAEFRGISRTFVPAKV